MLDLTMTNRDLLKLNLGHGLMFIEHFRTFIFFTLEKIVKFRQNIRNIDELT